MSVSIFFNFASITFNKLQLSSMNTSRAIIQRLGSLPGVNYIPDYPASKSNAKPFQINSLHGRHPREQSQISALLGSSGTIRNVRLVGDWRARLQYGENSNCNFELMPKADMYANLLLLFRSVFNPIQPNRW